MSRIVDINSILERFNWIDNSSSIQDVYDYYRFHCCDYDLFYDKNISEEKNDFYKQLYKVLNDRLKNINSESNNSRKKKVFLSHSHEDFEYTYRVGSYLKKNYNVNVYIDELDSLMPSSTNSDTARRLSEKIESYDRFVFIGTKNSFKSKWCNWELGVANNKNLKGHLAFFVMNDHPAKSGIYDKNEYVGLYPFIWDKKVLDIESDENDLFVGYYKDRGNWDLFVPLKDWLCKNDNFFNAVQKK
ncbi:toll/interleukin-1 receptor domain-containing protein [Candidatus Saccharibacteria bacterium]|nr:toll/interleukin-1 receptor domain-containing protein [Candidatus Saccharibacteria bacterium]